MNVDQLQTPPNDMLVWPVCRPFVEQVKKKLMTESLSELATALPCLIDPASVKVKGEFQATAVKQYELYTLGGNHLRTACKDLLGQGKLQMYTRL